MKKLIAMALSSIIILSILCSCSASGDTPDLGVSLSAEETTAISSTAEPTSDTTYSASEAQPGTGTASEQVTDDNPSKSNSSSSDNSIADHNANGNSNDNSNDNNTDNNQITNNNNTVSNAQNNQAITSSSVTANSSHASNQDKPKATAPPEQSSAITVYMSVECSTAVKADNAIAKAIAPNGWIINKTAYTVDKDSNAFELLKKSGLVLGSSSSAMGEYVYSIQSLAEKACGSGSGWLYSVNGDFIGTSCSNYTLKNGDVVEWRYTCNNGKDM